MNLKLSLKKSERARLKPAASSSALVASFGGRKTCVNCAGVRVGKDEAGLDDEDEVPLLTIDGEGFDGEGVGVTKNISSSCIGGLGPLPPSASVVFFFTVRWLPPTSGAHQTALRLLHPLSAPLTHNSIWPGPAPLAPQDYVSVLAAPAPLLFSTPLERSLLHNLSSLGFDMGQMVHSVLSDACHSSGVVWRMLKRRAEKNAIEDVLRKAPGAVLVDVSAEIDVDRESELTSPGSPSPSSSVDEPTLVELPSARSAPQLTYLSH